MSNVLAVGLAGMAGTLVRYWLSTFVDERTGSPFPAGTLAVNLVGCAVAGFLLHVLSERFDVSPVIRISVMIGFLGGFTTFSSFGLQTFSLLRGGQMTLALLNVGISNVGGLLCVWAGNALARAL